MVIIKSKNVLWHRVCITGTPRNIIHDKQFFLLTTYKL